MLKTTKLNALLEIGCEEIPARFMPGFLEELKSQTEERLKKERLSFDTVITLGTARRLTLFIAGLPRKQEDLTEEVRGPGAEIAFDPAGKPTQAAIGFARAQGVLPEKLIIRTIGQRNFVFAKALRRGQAIEKLLQRLLPELIAALYQPLAMRWGTLDFKFIRPIHSLVALCGKSIVKFELAGIRSGGRTFGRRYQNPRAKIQNQKVLSADLEKYKTLLRKLGVIVDQAERKALIKSEVGAAAKKSGLAALPKEELLAEVNYLVEWPQVYVGKFRPEFLSLPEIVLITSMQKNQKYFPLTDSQGKLQARFVVVTNGCTSGQVVAGNEKVLTARLADARFFFEEDKKIPLKVRAHDLGKVAFFEKLGTLKQKAERLEKMAGWIGKRWALDEKTLQSCSRIAELCKVDLTTKMVFEFPELQGAMGRIYALASGEDQRVADGIFEHYLPRTAEDKTPQTVEGAVLAIADRLDTMVGAFMAGFLPTGSEDPYGLRRAALGIIKIILAGKYDLLLDEAIDHSGKSYETLFPSFKDLGRVKKNLLEFIAGRLKPLLLDKGIRYDVAEAALFNFNDILDTTAKAEELNKVVNEEWLKGVIASADRLSRIAGNAPREQVLEHDFAEEAEKRLHELYLKVNWDVSERIKQEHWVEAATELAKLTDPIELFFDKVLVMHQDERLKLNRLALLKSLEKLYLSVADFRKIVIAG